MKDKRKNGSDPIQPGLDHRSTYRFSKIAALHARAFSTIYSRRFKLTVNTWKVLSVIGRFSPLSANTVGAHTSLEADKVTRAVDALVKQGYVVRRRDSQDRRRVVLTLSAKGTRVHDELNRLRDIIEHEFLRVLSAEEVAVLYRILDKLEGQAMRLFSDKDVWSSVITRLASPQAGRGKSPAIAFSSVLPARRKSAGIRSAATPG